MSCHPRRRPIRRVAIIVFAALVPAAIALAGCGSANSSGNAGTTASTGSDGAVTRTEKLQVVTTVAPITSIVSSVAGDRADVVGLVPEGTNSHTFEPPPSAAAVLSKADLIFINGLKLEDPTRELAESNMRDDATLVEIGTTVLPESEYIYDFSFPKDGGKPNPHLWTDPTWAIKYAEVARAGLTAADPADGPTYQANYDAFANQATELSDALKADQETIPNGNKELLTYHDAYAYFAKTYGWTIIGAIQPANFDDPTPKEIVDLIDQIKAEKVPVIFGSEVFPSDVLQEIADATGARYEDTLRDDDLPGVPGDPEHSWMGLMRYDFVTMINGLGGTATQLAALDTAPAVPDDASYPQ